MTVRHWPHDRAEVADEHAQLRQILASVRETIMDRAANPKVIHELLGELTRVVQDHFRHEEVGYFAIALAVAPRLTERAAGLLAQHPAMAAQLAAMQSHASRGDASERWWKQLQTMLASFLQEFSQHEAAENALLQEAFHDDLGSEE